MRLNNLLAQGTSCTYQGRLTDGRQPADRLYDFRAQLFNRAVAGESGDALVSPTLTFAAVAVNDLPVTRAFNTPEAPTKTFKGPTSSGALSMTINKRLKLDARGGPVTLGKP